MTIQDFQELTNKVMGYYQRVPKGNQRHVDEIGVALTNIVEEYRILGDKRYLVSLELNKKTKQYDELRMEFDTLSKEYEKLNKKLNNELIK